MRPTVERVEPTPDPVTAKLLHHRETSASVDTAGDEDVQGAPDQEAPDQAAEPSREAYHRSPLGLFEAAAKENPRLGAGPRLNAGWKGWRHDGAHARHAGRTLAGTG